jgi:hypothetical protein
MAIGASLRRQQSAGNSERSSGLHIKSAGDNRCAFQDVGQIDTPGMPLRRKCGMYIVGGRGRVLILRQFEAEPDRTIQPNLVLTRCNPCRPGLWCGACP